MATDPIAPPDPAAQPPNFAANNRFKILLLCLTLLVSGIIIGACGLYLWQSAHDWPRPPHDHRPPNFADRLAERIPLTEEQKTQINQIAQRHFETVHQKLDPLMDSFSEQLRDQLKTVVPSAYHDALDQDFQDARNRFKHFGPPGGGPRR